MPFCKSFCTYCDFYSELCGGDEAFSAYADAVVAEAKARASEISETQDINTLYVGGGAPSVLPLSVLGRIVSAVGGGPFGEFTVEVNPEDICQRGEAYVKGLLDLGVNRVSMGVQSFDDALLRWMNRRHDAARAIEAFGLLRGCGVGDISIDLIFGISRLTDEVWERTVAQAVALAPEHISAYQLSIEPGSALSRLVDRGEYVEAAEDLCRRQYDDLCAALGEAGYHHYEVSNFARPGFEAVHNSAYWSRAPYVGLGPGAHSLRGDVRSWNTRDLAAYKVESEVLSPDDTRIERVMLGLRTDRGIEERWLRGNADGATIDRLLAEGALARIGGREAAGPTAACGGVSDVTEGRMVAGISACEAAGAQSGGEARLRIPEDHFFVSEEIIRELV